MLLRQDFPSDPDYPDPLHFPSTPNYSDDAILDDCFMSDQPFQFNDPFGGWSSTIPLFGGQTQQQQQQQQQQFPYQSQNFASQPNNNSFGDFYQQGVQQQQPREWQLYGDGNFNAHSLNHALLSPQAQLRQHRRALSNSTATSQASTASPQQFPAAAYDSSYLEAYSHSGYQNYPTPSQTPTQDSFMDQTQNWRNRISTNQDLAQKGQRGSLTSVTSEPSQLSNNMTANQSLSNQAFEYPATPKTANGDFGDRQVKPQSNVTRTVPALGRTISDIYQDELYNPVTSSMPQPTIQQPVGRTSNLSPHASVMSDRLQAAYEARSSHSPVAVPREPSPFRPDSPYAMPSHPFGQIHAGQVGTAAGQRRQRKAEADAHAYQQHHMIPDNSAPKTISPQQAYLDDFHDPAEDSSVPLFQQNSSSSQPQLFDNGNGRLQYAGPLNARGQNNGNFNNFQPTSMPTMVQRQPPTLSQNNSSGGSVQDEPDFPAHLISMETSKSEPEPESSAESEVERPASTAADTGPYTCTFQHCTQRFASPAMLHRHKREAHRPMATSSKTADRASPRSSTGADSSVSPPKNSQAGPHRCDRINPSTGKPCNAIFSRPYDLTRHEDTIHARRGKVQCQYCTEEKTFSRADALTRHMRVVHPTIDFPGKHRRRHGD